MSSVADTSAWTPTTPCTPEQRHAAALVICDQARDVDEARVLLAMVLGEET